jgi:hypothetical protein
MGLGKLNPGCNCDCLDCQIWLDGCYLRWRCNADKVQVFHNGVLFSTQENGSTYRPAIGTWELRACNGVGCVPVSIGVISVPNLSFSECPSTPNCCFGKQYARYQVPNFTYDIETQTSRDYRVLIPGGFVGRNLTLVRLRERMIGFNFGGTYLFPIAPGCSHSVNQYLGTATCVSEGLITGTHTIDQPNGSLLTCNLNIETYAEFYVDIYVKKSAAGLLYFEGEMQDGNWDSVYTGIGRNPTLPGFYACGSISNSERIYPLSTRKTIAYHDPGIPITNLCEYHGPWRFGGHYGFWSGNYRFIVGGGTTFANVTDDFLPRQGFPVVPTPAINYGTGWFDYV